MGWVRRSGAPLAAFGLLGWLLGCDANAHIRLFEPGRESPPADMDASEPGQPDTGPIAVPPNPPRMDAGQPPRDAQTSLPDRDPPRRDGGAPTPPIEGGLPGSPSDSLILRYDFTGTGDVVRDRVGDADGRLMGGAMQMSGRDYVYLDGVDDYVDMPNGILSGLHSATFVAWVSWAGGSCWQRIFDFGISDEGEDEVGMVVTSLFMTPYACGRNAMLAMCEIGKVQQEVAAEEALPMGFPYQVVLVVDGDRQTFTLYHDQRRVAEAPVQFQLGQLTDRNNWLGRSQWVQDPYFNGNYGEFRIYSRALDGEEIAGVYAEGDFPR